MTMKLSIIIPVYNEKATIEEILRRVQAVDIDKEIIVSEDCSTDGTRELLKGLDTSGMRVIYSDRNYGKGHAIRVALAHVTGDIVLIQDADLEYDPRDYAKLIEPIAAGKADVVYGSRWLEHGFAKQPLNLFRLGRWLVTVLTDLLYGVKLTDEPCGYKVFRTDVIKSIPLASDGFDFCPEVTSKLLRRGHKIYEVAVSFHPRGVKDGKKITYWDGATALATLIRYRFWR